MKIRKIHIQSFKVFDNLELDFTDTEGKTLNSIIIAGLNGCGKTTILELIKDIFSGNIIKEIEKDFQLEVEFDFSDADWYEQFLIHIKENAATFECAFSFQGSYLSLSYVHKNSKKRTQVHVFSQLMKAFAKIQNDQKQKTTIIYKYSQDKTKQRRGDDSKDLVQEVSFNTHKDDLKSLILKPISDEVFKNRHTAPALVIEREIEKLTTIFEGMHLHSRFTDIDSKELFFESPNGKRILFDDLSGGEKNMYFMGFIISKLEVNNSMIIVDEPEDSLHPSWQNQLLRFYANIGTNNQVIFATHSPHVIGSVKSENVFLLKLENDRIFVSQPKYSKGHSIAYVLSEIMETDYRNTYVNNIVDNYLRLVSEGKHHSEKGKELFTEIETLDPNSEERLRIDMSLRRYKALGK